MVPLRGIQNFKSMNFQKVKMLVGKVASVKVTSECRFSDLLILVAEVGKVENTTMTIVVKDGTLTAGEMTILAEEGKGRVSFDFSEI